MTFEAVSSKKSSAEVRRPLHLITTRLHRPPIRHRALQTCALPLPLAYFAILICYWRAALAHPAAMPIRYSILDASTPLLQLISPMQSQIQPHGARPKY